MNIALVLVLAATNVGPPEGSACMQPDGADGFPKALSSPKELAHKTIAPGTSFTAGPLKISLKKAVVPAFLGASSGEAVVDAEVVIVGTDKSDSVHLPATVRIGTYRVNFDDVGKTPGTSIDVKAEDLGCAAEPKGKALKKGEVMTVWLSTEGVNSFKLFEGEDEYSTSDYFEMQVTSGLSPNAGRKVMLDDQQHVLTPAYVSLRAFARNANGNEAKDLGSAALMEPKAKLALPGHSIEVLKVVHGPKTKVRFKEPYALSNPAISVLVRMTRVK